MRGEQRLHRASSKRSLAREHLVGDHAERIQICAMVDIWIGGDLLRRHVRRRADRNADARQPAICRCRRCDEGFGHAKVSDERDTAGQQNVLRLDVAMHETFLMRVRKCRRDFAQEPNGFGNR
jgi:hypothetical protein